VENFAGETLKVEIERPQHEESPVTYTLVKETFPRLVTDEAVRQSWERTKPVAQIAAFHVGFIILYQDGTVETFGDRRFADCLGRDVDDEQFVIPSSRCSGLRVKRRRLTTVDQSCRGATTGPSLA
jgi:hypothetical protein